MTTILSQKLTIKFRQTVALDDVDLIIEGNEIIGILGRKGSGKTTLLSILAALKYPSSGTITVDGEDPFENSNATTKTCFTWSGQVIRKRGTIQKTLEFCSKLRPNWDMDYAHELLEKFELSLDKKNKTMTADEISLLNLVNGLASRAPITMFDGTYLNLSKEQKELFFNELKKDHENHPRTIILSTDDADEIESLVEDVIIFDRGHVISHATPDEIKSKAQELMGTPAQPSLQEILIHFTEGESK